MVCEVWVDERCVLRVVTGSLSAGGAARALVGGRSVECLNHSTDLGCIYKRSDLGHIHYHRHHPRRPRGWPSRLRPTPCTDVSRGPAASSYHEGGSVPRRR